MQGGDLPGHFIRTELGCNGAYKAAGASKKGDRDPVLPGGVSVPRLRSPRMVLPSGHGKGSEEGMSCEKFDPKCPHCRPVILDPKTNQVLPSDHPVMVAVNEVWASMSVDEQESFWKFTVKNSRAPKDIEVIMRMNKALAQKLEPNVEVEPARA